MTDSEAREFGRSLAKLALGVAQEKEVGAFYDGLRLLSHQLGFTEMHLAMNFMAGFNDVIMKRKEGV